MSYSVNVADDDQRTMSVDDIVRAYKAGEINGETYVWEDGMEDWLPIANVPAIMKAVNDAAGLPAAGGGVRAARREPSRGAIDLFGGGDDPPPSGGGGGGGDEPHFTGQRNEQSVLFSLNALGGSPAPKAPGSGPTGTSGSASGKSKTNEDSGLIDLGALAKAAEAQSASQQHMAMAPPIQLGSILGPSVLEAPSAPATVAPPAAQKNNTPIYVVGALITAAILGVGAMFALKGDPKPDPAAAATSATATTTAATTATAETTATATAPTSSASDPTATPANSGAGGAKPATPSGAGGKGAAPSGAGGKGAAGAAATAAPTPTPTTPPKPAAGPCGCAPGDLSCAIACKAKK